MFRTACRSRAAIAIGLWEARGALVAGRAYLLQHRAQEALPLLLRSVELSRQLYDPERSAELSDAQIALGECYLALSQLDQTRTLLSSTEAIQATHRELGMQYKEPLRKLRVQFAAGETRRSLSWKRSATQPNQAVGARVRIED